MIEKQYVKLYVHAYKVSRENGPFLLWRKENGDVLVAAGPYCVAVSWRLYPWSSKVWSA